ncbi:ASCH domain-containing protein [Psychrilyobacter sp.]|uniref:ASCH domain-containing protein n=1 Tax=Psychrilyobacter sp. TaxID=2586924 RepID=UPI00301A145F
MDSENKSVEIMWEKYLKSIGENSDNTDEKYTSWCFCDNKRDADELAGLVKQGIKRATAGLCYSYEIEGDKLPEVGDISIVKNWDEAAQCIIQTKKVSVAPFNEVSEEFARFGRRGR